MLSLLCIKCSSNETSKWFSGPICRKCYRATPEVKNREKQSRLKKLNHYMEVCRQYTLNNKYKIAVKDKRYYLENKEAVSSRKKSYRISNRVKLNHYTNEYQKARRQRDVSFRLRCSLRSRLSHAVAGRCKIGSAVDHLGCSIDELRLHLEAQFQPGMSWSNYSHSTWHIDHRLPLASFDLTNEVELAKACHYTNLQPLWARDNLSKSNRANYAV